MKGFALTHSIPNNILYHNNNEMYREVKKQKYAADCLHIVY